MVLFTLWTRQIRDDGYLAHTSEVTKAEKPQISEIIADEVGSC